MITGSTLEVDADDAFNGGGEPCAAAPTANIKVGAHEGLTARGGVARCGRWRRMSSRRPRNSIDPGATLAPTRWAAARGARVGGAATRQRSHLSLRGARRADLRQPLSRRPLPQRPRSYAGRTVLAKDPRRMIAGAQARRVSRCGKARRPGERSSGRRLATSRRRVELAVSRRCRTGVDGTALGMSSSARERRLYSANASCSRPTCRPALSRGGGLADSAASDVALSLGAASYVERDLPAGAVQRGVDNLLRVLERPDVA